MINIKPKENQKTTKTIIIKKIIYYKRYLNV